MESDDLGTKHVGRRRCLLGVPVSPGVSGVEEFVAVGDEVGAVVGVFVMIEGKDLAVWEELVPGVAFVGGLPHCVVVQPD